VVAMESSQRIARQVGAALRRLRLERGLTQRQFAANAGIPEAALSAYEQGKQLPDLRTLRLLLSVLRVRADEFGRHLGPWGGAEPKVTLTVHR
jgi:transcriptional regulator with XRE-family HTH domain